MLIAEGLPASIHLCKMRSNPPVLLTWRQDGIELVCSKHAQIGQGEGEGVVLFWPQLLGAGPLDEVRPVAADGVHVCAVSVLYHDS